MSNIKGILIFMVVFGHFLEIYKESFYELYLFIYAVHMPLFIFVSGFYAKRVTMSKVVNLAMLYLLFQTMYALIEPIAKFQLKLEVDYTLPFFHLWYLVSMIVWYLIALALLRMKNTDKNKIIILSIVLIVSVASRFITEGLTNALSNLFSGFYGYTLSYQRTLSFGFFFFLGFLMDHRMLDSVRTVISKKKMISIMSVIAIIVYISFANKYNLEMIFRGAFGIEEMTTSIIPPIAQILICYVISTYMCFILLNVVSGSKSFLTNWGDNSLQIFLFHAFAVIPLIFISNLLSGLNFVVLLIILFIIALIVTTVLSSSLFTNRTSGLCNPYFTIRKVIDKKRTAGQRPSQ